MSDASVRIGVLVEREPGPGDHASASAEALVTALSRCGHHAIPIVVDSDVDLMLRQARIQVAFLALPRAAGRSGCIQGLLEILGIPYTGSGVLASALAVNRAKAKEVLRLRNLPTAVSYVYDANGSADVVMTHGTFGFPAVVRPVQGPTHGAVGVVRNEPELEAAVDHALRFGDRVLIERKPAGQEICVAVLDGDPLGGAEIQRTGNRVPVARPMRTTPERYRALLRLAGLAYEALGCEGLATVDLVACDQGNELILGADTQPDLSPGALAPRLAEAAGLSFTALVERVLLGAHLGSTTAARRARSQFAQPVFHDEDTSLRTAH